MSSEKHLNPDQLRKAAEERMGPSATVEELHIHQVELEMQQEELQRIYAELKAQHKDYLELFDKAPIAYLETDSSGTLLRVNETAYRLLGLAPGGQLKDAVAPEDAETFSLFLSQTVELSVTETRFQGRRGPFLGRLMLRNLSRHKLLAIEDVTELREAQDRVGRSERNLRAILEAAPDAIVVLSQGRVLFANQALCRLLQREAEQLLQQEFSEFSETDKALPTGEFALKCADRTQRQVECRSVELQFQGQKAQLLLMRDLTERRRLEAQMAHSERLAAVGLLVAGVAHELNNPLAFVLANLQHLQEKLSTQLPELSALVDETTDGVRRMTATIKDLRTFYQSEDRMEIVRVNSVVVQTLRLANPKVAHHCQVSRDLGKIPDIVANATRLSQVLLNLILNAAEALPTGRPGNIIRVQTFATARDVCISVQDNGCGIPTEDQPHLFDPFFTTRRDEGGTGLGLAISNSLIQQMGGFIGFESSEQRGSKFLIHLPRQDTAVIEVPSPRERKPCTGRATPRKDLRILVVDDEPNILSALVRCLSSFGEVIALGSGNQAIAQLQESADFDVVLTDLVMQDGTGQELANWIAQFRPELMSRLLFATGMPRPGTQTSEQIPRLQKPFDLQELRDTVLRIADREAEKA